MNNTLLQSFLLASCLLGSLALSATQTPLNSRDSGYYMFSRKQDSTSILTVWLKGKPMPDFWTSIRERSELYRRTIWKLEFKKPQGYAYKLPDFTTAKQQLDQWLQPAEGCQPCPEKLFAVVLAEENIYWDGQEQLMEQIGNYLRNTYRLKVYQWLSEPLLPRHAITADGWIADMYSVKNHDFYGHLEAFILYGKPVVPVLWGSGHFDKYFLGKTFPQLTTLIHERMDHCRNLNLPVIMFSVTQNPYGSVSAWFDTCKDPQEQAYRQFIREYLEDMPTASRPLACAAPHKSAIIMPKLDGHRTMILDGSDFAIARNTNFSSPYHWQVTPEGLKAKRQDATLEWDFKPTSTSNIQQLTLDIQYEGSAEAALSDGRSLPLPAGQPSLTITSGPVRNLVLRLKAQPDFRLKKLAVNSTSTIMPSPKDMTQQPDGSYLATPGFQDGSFIASVTQHEMQHCTPDLSANGIGIPGAPGYASALTFTQSINLPISQGKLTFEAKLHADAANYGAEVSCKIMTDSQKELASFTSEAAKTNHTWKTTVDIPANSAQILLVWSLKVGCGAATPNRTPAKIYSYSLKATK